MTDFKKIIIEKSDSAYKEYLPHISIDTVIFGFEEQELHILMLKMNFNQEWFLPGGYLFKEEDIDAAANRILFNRTGAQGLFLQQFWIFGGHRRNQDAFSDFEDNLWNKQRFITIGYYALVNYSDVNPITDELSEICEWVPLAKIKHLKITMDHLEIIERALATLRLQISFQPIGFNLLPEKFTLNELQRLYEIIVGRKLNRGNFYRKMKNLGILIQLEETRTNKGPKSPNLYSFNPVNYQLALENGIDRW